MINVISFLAMIILSMLSFKNVRRIRSIPRRQRQGGRTMHKKDFQLLRCLYAKNVVYIFCEVLLCAYLIYKFIPKPQAQVIQEQQLTTFIFNLSSLIGHIPSCASFYIYVVISRAFRQSFQRQLWKILGKDLVNIREEEPHEAEIRRDANELAIVNTIVS